MKDGRINNSEQLCSVQIVRTEWGERLIVAENGCLSFTVTVDRAMDIYSVRHNGTNMAFLSKNGLRSYRGEFDCAFEGGLLYTCGTDTVGGRALPIHGRLHSTPAEILEATADENGIVLRGRVRSAKLFGENIVLYRTIRSQYKSGALVIENRLVNEGFVPAEYCLLFHTNFGYPFLDDGVKISADIIETVPRNRRAEVGLSQCLDICAPRAGEEEQVYFHRVRTGNIEIVNKKAKKRATVSYDNKVMPYFIEWKSMACGDYALGIEPSTTTLDEDFRRETLGVGESVDFPLTIRFDDL